jgi:3-hydroxybutyryl-CoA dehydrogenase
MLDFVGMNTAYNVVKSMAESNGDEVWKQRQGFMKENFIDQNKLGISTGEGFYKYPNPAYQDADFLK